MLSTVQYMEQKIHIITKIKSIFGLIVMQATFSQFWSPLLIDRCAKSNQGVKLQIFALILAKNLYKIHLGCTILENAAKAINTFLCTCL